MKYTMRSATEKRELVAAWQSSGLSMTRFAKRAGVSPTSLRQWSGRLRSSPTATMRFVNVEVVETESASPLVVEVAGTGHRVVVPMGFDAAELRRLVAALC